MSTAVAATATARGCAVPPSSSEEESQLSSSPAGAATLGAREARGCRAAAGLRRATGAAAGAGAAARAGIRLSSGAGAAVCSSCAIEGRGAAAGRGAAFRGERFGLEEHQRIGGPCCRLLRWAPASVDVPPLMLCSGSRWLHSYGLGLGLGLGLRLGLGLGLGLRHRLPQLCQTAVRIASTITTRFVCRQPSTCFRCDRRDGRDGDRRSAIDLDGGVCSGGCSGF